MPSWNELLSEFTSLSTDADKSKFLHERLTAALDRVSSFYGGRNVLFYASSFLQKPTAPGSTIQITHEDLNGYMSVMFGMDWTKGLILLLHTPGGITNAAETIVSYLRSKFSNVVVVIPTLAMSAGTMISLSAERVVMGRQSQLGPIDPQMPVGGRYVSARAIVDQFDRGKDEVMKDLTAAHVWAPILQSLGPALLQEAQNALDYGETMVGRWLKQYMFSGRSAGREQAERVATYFSAAVEHKSHGRRIDRDEARGVGLIVDDLEADQGLQDDVLTAYHMSTIAFEQGPAAKMLWSNAGRSWLKNWVPVPATGGPGVQP